MPERISELVAKYKGHAAEWILSILLVLTGLTAFGLGRLSAMGEEGARLLIRLPDGTTQTAAAYQSAAAPAEPGAAARAGAYVASKSGSKYYPSTCAGAARIKEENKIWFATVADAESAGYTAAANC